MKWGTCPVSALCAHLKENQRTCEEHATTNYKPTAGGKFVGNEWLWQQNMSTELRANKLPAESRLRHRSQCLLIKTHERSFRRYNKMCEVTGTDTRTNRSYIATVMTTVAVDKTANDDAFTALTTITTSTAEMQQKSNKTPQHSTRKTRCI